MFFVAHLTNRPLPLLGGRSMPEGVIHLERVRFLANERLHEHIELLNYGDQEAVVPLSLRFGADFRDMFEVRGQSRSRRGRLRPAVVEGNRVIYRYEGLDQILRTMVISFSVAPIHLSVTCADFAVTLPPSQRRELYLCIGTQLDVTAANRRTFRLAAAGARRAMRARMRRGCRPRTSARLYNEWLQKSQADLAMLTLRPADGTLSVCGHPVVLSGLRARRHRHGTADAVARRRHCPGRAALPRAAPGDRDLGLPGCSAWQDHP